jgi:hypothetical protein
LKIAFFSSAGNKGAAYNIRLAAIAADECHSTVGMLLNYITISMLISMILARGFWNN